jgi:hypothetical protein
VAFDTAENRKFCNKYAIISNKLISNITKEILDVKKLSGPKKHRTTETKDDTFLSKGAIA